MGKLAGKIASHSCKSLLPVASPHAYAQPLWPPGSSEICTVCAGFAKPSLYSCMQLTLAFLGLPLHVPRAAPPHALPGTTTTSHLTTCMSWDHDSNWNCQDSYHEAMRSHDIAHYNTVILLQIAVVTWGLPVYSGWCEKLCSLSHVHRLQFMNICYTVHFCLASNHSGYYCGW